MELSVLALDASYIPIARLPWQRALTLYFLGKVEIVEEYEDKEIRSVSFVLKLPSVVRFIRALRGRKHVVKFSRESIYVRDRGRCQFCNTSVPRATFTYDHVVPRAQGGKTEWTNIVISCMPCNQRKGNRTPGQAGMKLLSLPVKPKKLADQTVFTLRWRVGDPPTWRDWLASHSYWNGELDSE